jgi:hypothetical protein
MDILDNPCQYQTNFTVPKRNLFKFVHCLHVILSIDCDIDINRWRVLAPSKTPTMWGAFMLGRKNSLDNEMNPAAY